MNKPKPKLYKSVDQLICRTTSKTFLEYYKENRRHEEALKKIWAKDKNHTCIPEEQGSVSQVHPDKKLLVTFYRCEVCMKDMTQEQVDAIKPWPKGRKR